MTSLLSFVCVLACGMLAGMALLVWFVLHECRDAELAATVLTKWIATMAGRHGYHRLSTRDDEGRLVLIEIDQLCESLRAQIVLWCQPATPDDPTERIHFDPPEGSA